MVRSTRELGRGAHACVLACVAFVAASGCSDGDGPPPIGVATAALDADAGMPANAAGPVREIALVLDGSGNIGPRCDWDPDQAVYGTDTQFNAATVPDQCATRAPSHGYRRSLLRRRTVGDDPVATTLLSIHVGRAGGVALRRGIAGLLDRML